MADAPGSSRPWGSPLQAQAVDTLDVTMLLSAARSGDRAALERLMPAVYDELRRRAAAVMRRERAEHTLQPTALVHELFLQLAEQTQTGWQDRAHFFAIASRLMRRILVDHARARLADKRGGGLRPAPLDEGLSLSPGRDDDVLRVEDALERLSAEQPELADLVVMRFFGGMSVDEVAAVRGVSRRTIEARWTFVRAWLRRELSAR